MSDLTGKTAVITGAASGIGAAVARRFVLAGANVVAADLNQTGLDALCKELGSPVAAISGDVTDRAYLEALSALAIERFGAIDIDIYFLLINFLDCDPECSRGRPDAAHPGDQAGRV